MKSIFTRFGKASARGSKFDEFDLWSAVAAGLVMLLLIDLPQYLKRDHCVMLKWSFPVRSAVFALLFFWIIMIRGRENVPFIYFQF